jgi:hypothetical protein
MDELTLRDFFAGMALVALLNRHEGPLSGFASMSRQAYLIADQMVKMREDAPVPAREAVR